MIINGCLVDNEYIDDEQLKEIFEELGFSGDIADETLAVIGGEGYYKITSNITKYSDYTLTTPDGMEYRLIHENDIQEVFGYEAEVIYDRDMWVEDVNAGGTDESYSDWLDAIIDDGDYASFFASYDGGENYAGNYNIYRVN